MKMLCMVHNPGPNPGHAVEGNSAATLCGRVIGLNWSTARGLFAPLDFERIAKASVIAGACPDCVEVINRRAPYSGSGKPAP